jgi:hypothetical protein
MDIAGKCGGGLPGDVVVAMTVIVLIHPTIPTRLILHRETTRAAVSGEKVSSLGIQFDNGHNRFQSFKVLLLNFI